jgi:hypothetical protein
MRTVPVWTYAQGINQSGLRGGMCDSAVQLVIQHCGIAAGVTRLARWRYQPSHCVGVR